jgi:catechol 2,3-dioxygenase-like lactoylglutathione lyase family enzyme
LTFFVEDAQATYEELSARGVSFLSPPVPADDAAAVMCAPDPDGILIEFVQLLPEETASDGLENSEERS